MNFVRMRRSLILGSLVAVLFASTTAGVIGGGLSHASAEELVSLTKDNAALFLPERYEQYLALTSPVSAAMSDDYIAIADGSTLYIYDRAKGGYTSFSHVSYTEHEKPENISKVQIAEVAGPDNDRIFFSDNGHLYEYTEGQSSEKMIIDNVPVQTFLIDNASKSLFTAQATTDRNEISIHRYSVEDKVDATSSKAAATIPTASSPNLALGNGVLYVAYNNTNVAHFQAENLTNAKYEMLSDGPVTGLQSVCAFHGELYYTVKNESEADGLYRSANGEAVRLPLSDDNDGGLSALTVYKDELYCIRGTSVLKLDVKEDGAALCDYEITAGSASVNRLNGATDCVRAGDLLVTADKDNDRISVYDLTKKSFEVLPCAGVQYVATDGERIAAASSDSISIFENVWSADKGAFALSQTATIEQNNVNGLACVYDAFYFVTQDYYYGVLTRENGNWTKQAVQRALGQTPKALAANLYGDLYIAYEDTTVRSFTEEQFTSADEQGTVLAGVSVPAEAKTMRADFEGGLYYLDESGNLCGKNGETLATVDGKNFVYTNNESKTPVSFALGFEDDEAYFCFGDFIVKSNAGTLGVATLESVSRGVLETAQETLTAVQPAEDVTLADFAEGAVGIHVDPGALIGDTPCSLGYARYPDARRGVLLSQQEKYSLVALYHDHVYSVELFRSEDVAETVSPENTPMGGEKMYLSSNCAPCNFPCILDAPARAQQLPRGTQVTVLAVLDEGGQEAGQGGYTFAYIEYETQARARVRGYVPVAYLSAANPLGDESEQYFLGYVKPGTVFAGSDGSEVTLTERTAARIYENGDGTYTARYEKDGVSYSAHVLENQIERGESDALRIALIIILSVLAAVIIGAYVFLLPRNKKSK